MHQNTYLKALVLYLLTWITSGQGIASHVIFPLYGNVYPLGYYNVTVMVGNPPKPYFLDIDTGSNFTWLQCDADATNGSCINCFEAPHTHYKAGKNQVACNETICQSFQPEGDDNCLRSSEPNKQCDYIVHYADYVSSLGVLVWDNVSLDLANGTRVAPRLAFGCGYKQVVLQDHRPPYVDGILGLGKGGPNILAQLQSMGVTRNVLGHCFISSRGGGGGYLFFGDILMPGIAWTPITNQSDHYHLGSADLQYSGPQTTTNIVTGLEVVFDSGSTYTYFTSQAYGALLDAIKDWKGYTTLEVAVDENLPMCWNRSAPFKSIDDAITYFKPLVLNFTNGKNVQFELRPESYLIFTEEKNACLGILNGTEVGLGDTNIIGDISMQDKLVIYHNEKNKVGWAPVNCSTYPKS